MGGRGGGRGWFTASRGSDKLLIPEKCDLTLPRLQNFWMTTTGSLNLQIGHKHAELMSLAVRVFEQDKSLHENISILVNQIFNHKTQSVRVNGYMA